MFSLAIEQDLIAMRPHIKMLKEAAQKLNAAAGA